MLIPHSPRRLCACRAVLQHHLQRVFQSCEISSVMAASCIAAPYPLRKKWYPSRDSLLSI